MLAEHFLVSHARKLGVSVPELSPEALRALMAYDFPGNVRDLENSIVRALVLSEPGDIIGLADLPGIPASSHQELESHQPADTSTEAEESGGLLATVARYEREQIELALETTGGNRAQAARKLGISRRWLLKKLERYGMASPNDDCAE